MAFANSRVLVCIAFFLALKSFALAQTSESGLLQCSAAGCRPLSEAGVCLSPPSNAPPSNANTRSHQPAALPNLHCQAGRWPHQRGSERPGDGPQHHHGATDVHADSVLGMDQLQHVASQPGAAGCPGGGCSSNICGNGTTHSAC